MKAIIKMCNSCPFNYDSDEADFAQNTGCLPTPREIIQIKDTTGHNWACHSNPKRKCKGLSEHRDTSHGGIYVLPGVNSDFISWDKKDLSPVIISE